MQAGHGIGKLAILQNPRLADILLHQPTANSDIHTLHPSTNPPGKKLLTASSLTCVRGERTLFTGLNVDLHEGQCLHVIGANGGGKTSLLRILSGINRPERGAVHWAEQPIIANSTFFACSAFIGHKDGLKNELTAAENLDFYHRLEGGGNQHLVDDHLAQMGILQCADLPANKLSFGQRRRLAFARLLQAGFKLWILDEPFTGIDNQGRQLIEGICVEHLHNNGMIILTNHQSLASSGLAKNLCELEL